MQTLAATLKTLCSNALEAVFSPVMKEEGPLVPADLTAEVTQAAQPQHGHYQCNNALRVAKKLKKPPREVAQMIVDHVENNEESKDLIEKIEIAGPGFINFFLKPSALAAQIDQIVRDGDCGIGKPEKREKIIVEFSSPNIAKELHVGHLRSTIIGESISRLFETLGHQVVRLNHVGDWGTQFGMLIAYMHEEHPDVLSGSEETDISSLMNWYRESKKRFDEDEQFRTRAKKKVVSLQGGDQDALAAWNRICDISRKAFEEVYNILDVKIHERGESFYNPFLKGVVEELEEKELIKEDNGAKCIFLDGFTNREGDPLPMIIQKSDGGYNYSTTDMAALKYRVDEDRADQIFLVVDAGQALHFQMIFKAAEKAGYYNPEKTRVQHVGFGVVLGPDGKKFKTRSGETEKLVDLLQEAVSRARTVIGDRSPHFTKEEVDELASVLGIDAIKYEDLKNQRLKDYTFSYERMLKFEGNTAAFLLYSYVRILSILRKSDRDIQEVTKDHKVEITHESEMELALHLRRFTETLHSVARDLVPNRLCDYLYELANHFNAFFRDCRVVGGVHEESRLILCDLTREVFEKGLHVLSLKPAKKM